MTWRRVSPSEPCPICGKPDNCTVSASGGAVWCGRVSEGSVKVNDGGQHLHFLNDDQSDKAFSYVHPAHLRPTPLKPKPPTDRALEEVAVSAFQSAERGRQTLIAQQRRFLSSLLGVSVESLVRLQVGWHVARNCWTFPERDAQGRIIGISQRFLSGRKQAWEGGKRGLTFAPDWDSGSGPVFVAEGGSCVAAGLDVGLNVIGRPSNSGGSQLLAAFFADFPKDRDILILGERDEKPDGQFPGRDGAISVSKTLAERLQRPIGWTFPPGKAKDVRHWLNSGGGCE